MAKRTPPSTSAPAPRKRAAAKKPNGAAAAPADPQPSADDIRLRAYHRYLERGGAPGGDFDDWIEAEKDLKTTRS